MPSAARGGRPPAPAKVGVVLHKAGDRPADEVQIGVHRAVRSLQGTRNFVDRPPAPHREVERHSCAQHDSRKQQQNHLNQQRVQPLHRLLFRQNEQITQAQRVTARKVQDQIVAAVPCALRGQPVFGQAVGQIQVIVAVQADPAVVIVQHKQRIAVVLLQNENFSFSKSESMRKNTVPVLPLIRRLLGMP